MIREEIKNMISDSDDFYAKWLILKFFKIVKKKDEKYRLINHAIELNKYIIRDANLPLNINTFLEEFVGYAVTSFINFFSGYDYVELDLKCRDITVFIILLGFLK